MAADEFLTEDGPVPGDDDDGNTSDDGLYQAWCVITNARDWLLDDAQAKEWVAAATRWRDEVFHPSLAGGPPR